MKPQPLRVAVFGHGKMGREILGVLEERGHQARAIARDEPVAPGTAVAIDFTRSEAVEAHVKKALAVGARVVVGTTGWAPRLADVRAIVAAENGGLVHASNFSLGVNLFYRIVAAAAEVLKPFPEYDPYIQERHHRGKADSPSGTAKSLAALLEKALPILRAEQLSGALEPGRFHVSSLRAGGIVGDHTVGFDSGGDEILLEHRSRSRRGYAVGAVLAAEWIASRTGFYPFEAVLEDLMRPSAAPGA